ncbi:MAG: lipocalin family protein [Elusimicrobiota bacterium]|nr:lipocalin family protein [Elusimicrobiota bacterium]
MKILALMVLLLAACSHVPLDSQPMPRVETEKYMGKWYEIARLPNRFEKGCDGVTAEYALRKDGTVSVLNTCRKGGPQGPERTASAKAWSVDPSGSRYEVSFFRPFKAPYWIIELDPQYRWAAVGHPDRKYLWILSREKTLPPEIEKDLIAKLQTLGYDTARLERPKQ